MPTLAGRTNYPKWNAATDSPDGAAQDEALGAHFDALIGETVATASALPASNNWPGRLIVVASDKSLRVWNGAGWDNFTARFNTSGTTPISGNSTTGGVSAGNFIINCPVAMRVRIQATFQWVSGANAAGTDSLKLGSLAGAVIASARQVNNGTTAPMTQTLVGYVDLPAGNSTIHLEFKHEGGGNVRALPGGTLYYDAHAV